MTGSGRPSALQLRDTLSPRCTSTKCPLSLIAAGTVQEDVNHVNIKTRYSIFRLPCTCTMALKVAFPAVQRYSPLSVVLTEHSSNTEANSFVSLMVTTREYCLLHDSVQELSLRIGPVELLQTILSGVGAPEAAHTSCTAWSTSTVTLG